MVAQEQAAGRLVFDDLGALFWSLLERFPTVERAYLERYPSVIADEHQDASALQDAVARRFGRTRLVVFAHPMQLIHGFRGASPQRLERHRAECGEVLSLATPHRWHGSRSLAAWLLAVRARLEGREAAVADDPPGTQLRIEYSTAAHGFNAVKAQVKYAVHRAFEGNLRSVAVLARSNEQVAQLRSYLSREGLLPRQIGGRDFEDAREDIEQLPLLQDPQSVALHALGRIEELVPTLPGSVLKQVRQRLGAADIDLSRAGPDAKRILEPLGCSTAWALLATSKP